MTLSVIVITKNESKHLADCLDSVGFADEIIVVDSGSSDDTCAIAASRGAKVTSTDDWPGFGPQKNRALDQATQDWVLSIDADERVTPELAIEIQAELVRPRAEAYKVARLSNFCGRWIRHSGWWPDHVVRLFKRGTARFNNVAVHESLQTAGPVLVLESHLLHYPYPDIDSLLVKINRYSTDAATMMYAQGERAGVMKAAGHAAWTFFRIYIIRRGFLDGREGFVLAAAGAAGNFFRYSKLMFMSRQNK